MSKTYVTVQGDMWDVIAHQEMGSTSHTDKLITANMARCNTFIFPAGVELTIPDVPTPPPGGMPPWKQVSEHE